MKICEYCNIKPVKERTDRETHFCSVSCANKSRRTNFPKSCGFCHNVFQPPRSNPKQKYCSTKCRDNARSLKLKVNCSWCEKELVRKKNRVEKLANSFCDKICETAWRMKNAPQGKDHPQYKKREVFECESCGKTFERLACRNRNHVFCSKSCQLIWQQTSGYSSKENSPTWRGGCEDYRGPNWKKQRALALERDRYICQICGIPTDEVHHLIPYSEYTDYLKANDLQNLKSLCPSCHQIEEWSYRKVHPFISAPSLSNIP